MPLVSSLPTPLLSVGSTRPKHVCSSTPAVAVVGRIAPVRFSFLLLCCPLTSCFQCERCRDKKKGCIAAVAGNPRGPCALCVKTGVMCIRSRGVVGEFFTLYCASWFDASWLLVRRLFPLLLLLVPCIRLVSPGPLVPSLRLPPHLLRFPSRTISLGFLWSRCMGLLLLRSVAF